MNARKWQFPLVAALALAAIVGSLSCTTSDATAPDPGGNPGSGSGTQVPPDLQDVLPEETCGSAGTTILLAGRALSPSNDPIPGVTINGVPADVVSVSVDPVSGLDLVTVRANPQTVVIPPNGLFVDVRVTNDNGSDTLVSAIHLLPPCQNDPNPAPVIVTIDPSQGARTGGTAVTLQGDNLACATAVQFVGNRGGGTLNAPILGVISDQEIVVRSPVSGANNAGEQFSIVVTTPCGTVTLPDAWTYTGVSGGPGAVPNALSITPASGPATGGNQVLITGNDLNLVTSINFGGTSLSPGAGGFILTATGDILIPAVPASIAGASVTVAISVTVSGANGADPSPVTYTYIGQGAPTCATLNPTSGSVTGGVQVTITGTGLSTVTGVLFGGRAATAIVHPNATTIVATTPAYTAAVDVDVELQVGGVTVSRCAAAFTYIADNTQAFTVTSVSPRQGPQTGGDQITIAGTGLDAVSSVSICGVQAVIIQTTQTQVTATTGAYGGTVPQDCDVVVRTGGGLQASLVPPSGYRYLPVVPDATSFSATGASTAPEAGGTAFRLTGTNLIGVRTVTFSGVAGSTSTACNVQVQSNTEVTGIAPRYFTPGGPFPADVSVVVSTATGADSTPVSFRYYGNPTLGGAVGPGGTNVVTAGDLIRVTGNNLRPMVDGFVSSVTLSNSGVSDPANAPAGAETLGLPFTIVDNNLLQFTFPAVRFQDFYEITITTPNGGLDCTNTYTFTLNRALFSGTPPPVSAVRPNRGRWDGGTVVVVAGSYASPVTSVTIGGVQQTIIAQTSSSVTISTRGLASEALAGTPEDVVVTTQAGSSTPLPGAYTFIPDPDITSIETNTPNCGLLTTTPLPVTQGQTFIIRGNDLVGVNRITVGTGATAQVATINSVTDTQVVAQAPTNPSATGLPGPYDATISVIFDAAPSTPPATDAPYTDGIGGAFAYQNAPSVTSLAPATGSSGTVVTISGTDLRNVNGTAVNVTFGVNPSANVSPNGAGTSLTAIAPVGAEGSRVPVNVTTCQGSVLAGTFTYPCVTQPNITGVAPTSGASGGGTPVVITGTNLLSADGTPVVVTFGTTNAVVDTATSTSTTLNVTAPAGTAGTAVSITVRTCAGSVTAAQQFIYGCVTPTITAIAPIVGAAGTTVTLTGNNLVNPDGSPVVVQFGGTNAVVSSSSATSLTALAPAGAGVVNVTVTTCGGTGTAPQQFQYCVAPTVTSATPLSGPAGTVVNVIGTGLRNPDSSPGSVTFGSAPGTPTGGDPAGTTVGLIAPAGTGSVLIRYTTCGGTVNVGTFLYCAAPSLETFSPAQGPANTVVTLTGANFLGADGAAPVVTFAGTPATVLSASATSLVVRAPVGVTGQVAIAVSTCGGTSQSASLFNYCAVPTVTGVVANNGPAGTTVTVQGTDLVGSDGVEGTVTFGSQTATVLNVTPTALLVTVPTGPVGSTVNVRVRTCGGQSAIGAGTTFTYSASTSCTSPTISSVTPSAAATGSLVTIVGTGLIGNDSVVGVVRFGATVAPIVTSTATRLVVTVPAGAGNVAVSVTTCGGTANASQPFTYCAVPTVTAINPISGSSSSNVTITGTNFLGADGAEPLVFFGTVPAQVLNRTATTILVEAPGGFSAGTSVNVRVTTCGGSATGPLYTYTGTATCTAPTVTSISPEAGVQNNQVVLNGTNLIGADGVPGTVQFGTNPATVITSTATQLVVTVPAGAGSVAVRVTTCGGVASAPDPFVYCVAPTVTNINPTTGPAGTVVTISGTNFLGANGAQPIVAFGTQTAVVVNVTANQILATAPTGIPSGTLVNVRVTTCGGTATAGTQYQYTAGTVTCTAPVVTGIAPASGVGGAGGTQVTISGTNLLGADGLPSTVRFGATLATIVTATSTQIIAVPPAGVGSVAVSVTTCGGTAQAPSPFVYCTAPAITAMNPTTGASGTSVTLTGSNLVGADGTPPVVRFGAQVASIVSATGTSVIVTAPAGVPAGTSVPVSVSTCGGTATFGTPFLYSSSGTTCSAPTVSSISPTAGVGGGTGTIVTLSGSNLVGADGLPTVVTFGGVAAPVITSTSGTLTVRAPAGPVGSVAVRVSTCGGQADAPQPFTYCVAPAIGANIAPATGGAGTVVTITGTNLVGADGAAPVVRFGTATAALVSQSAASLQVSAPTGVPNGTSVPVTVTTCGGTATAPNTFTYSGTSTCTAPTVASINPTAGIGGATGTVVTITGTNLVGADGLPTVVTFGGTNGTIITSTATVLTVRAPAGPVGQVAVRVSTCGGQADAPQPFTYCLAPTITIPIAPATGPAATIVTITGTNLVGADGAAPVVRFGTSVAALVSQTATSLQVSAPAGIANGTAVPVTVTTCGGTVTSPNNFTYSGSTGCTAPTVTNLTPTAGVGGGAGTIVTITGTNLVGADGLPTVVLFGAANATVITNTPTTITARVPAGAGTVAVSVTTCGGTANAPQPFTYCVVPSITTITPTNGPAGTVVTLGGSNLVGADGAAPTVTFGSRPGTVLDSNALQVIVDAPSGFSTGTTVSVKLTTCGGTATAPTAFTFQSSTTCVAPTVTSIAPQAGPNGTQVILTGTNLIGNDGATGTVSFGATAVPPANVLAATSTTLVVLAPAGAGSVPVTVTTCGGQGVAPTPYVYCNLAPAVTGLLNLNTLVAAPPYPLTGLPDQFVEIQGTNLVGANGATPVVRFGTTEALVLDARPDRITVQVPTPVPLPIPAIVTINVTTCGGTDNTDGGGAFLNFQYM